MKSFEEIYKGNLDWLKSNTIFITIHGSQSYGTNTPESDIDMKGICIPPKEYYFGFNKNFEQAEQSSPVDLVIYSLEKFMKLASDCNPNIIEVLFTDPSKWILKTPIFEKLYENRHAFLSMKAKYTFSGYAISQLKRMKTHRNWLLNPVTHKPTREEFGLSKSHKINPSIMGAIKNLEENHNAGFSDHVMKMLAAEKRYAHALQNYNQYMNWRKTRNKKRGVLEDKCGYDCYSADTEFLTETGWKHFDKICHNDKLATVYMGNAKHKTRFCVEYQNPTNIFDSIYNGPMYHITGTHTDCFVTANHRMLFQKQERKSKKEFEWELESADKLPDMFKTLIAPVPKTATFKNQELSKLPIKPSAYMSLMGWYLSDGCVVFRKNKNNKKPKSIRISQKKGGKLSWKMARWNGDYKHTISTSLYENKRLNGFVERILDVRESSIVNAIVDDCSFLKNKRIPRYVFSLSKRLMEKLIYGMIGGDGTKIIHDKKDTSYVYYSSLKGLADDIQELALLCGWETALWGPYDHTDLDGRQYQMFQVHLRPNKNKINKKTLIRNSNIEKINVLEQRVVCFTVPNGTLVTRRNGKVSIHGNCKNAMHLVRLMRMCKEIITTGEVIVARPDAKELLEIRNGSWTYDELINWANELETELNELYNKTDQILPYAPNKNKLDKLCIELTEEFLFSK